MLQLPLVPDAILWWRHVLWKVELDHQGNVGKVKASRPRLVWQNAGCELQPF